MLKTKNIFKLMLGITIALIFLFSTFTTINTFEKRRVEATEQRIEWQTDAETSERLLTNLEISLNGGNGEVWATVKNKFTLFPSTVYVIVQLYVSDVYCEDYKEMTLVVANSTTDLDMGHTIEARASTEGKQRYWMGRMRYKIDGNSWEERTAGVGLYSGTGEFLGIL